MFSSCFCACAKYQLDIEGPYMCEHDFKRRWCVVEFDSSQVSYERVLCSTHVFPFYLMARIQRCYYLFIYLFCICKQIVIICSLICELDASEERWYLPECLLSSMLHHHGRSQRSVLGRTPCIANTGRFEVSSKTQLHDYFLMVTRAKGWKAVKFPRHNVQNDKTWNIQ